MLHTCFITSLQFANTISTTARYVWILRQLSFLNFWERNWVFKKFFKSLFIHFPALGLSCYTRHFQSLRWHVASFLVVACRVYCPDQGLIPGPLHWEYRVLATGLPGKPQRFVFLPVNRLFWITDLILEKDLRIFSLYFIGSSQHPYEIDRSRYYLILSLKKLEVQNKMNSKVRTVTCWESIWNRSLK